MGLTITTLTSFSRKATKFGKITPNDGLYGIQLQGHHFGTSRKLICACTNLYPISHHFQDITDYWLHFCC